eukprot:NODE_88_length_21789_cov_0.534440.p13 type:complete len:217 gc:universal NODE_88_length_21789_cov_0.534440:7610-6960(-)
MELRSRKGKKSKESLQQVRATEKSSTTKKSQQKLLFKPIGLRDIFHFILVGILLSSIISYLTTETIFFHYKFPDFNDIKKLYFDSPPQLRQFTIEELAAFDGTNDKPIYLAIKGKVYDVSSKPKSYGPEGGYKFFAAKDASRAYGTGCFKDHLTHDLRGVTEDQMKSIDSWVSFYEKHKEYTFIGYVELPEPTGPIPEDCNKEEEKKEEKSESSSV